MKFGTGQRLPHRNNFVNNFLNLIFYISQQMDQILNLLILLVELFGEHLVLIPQGSALVFKLDLLVHFAAVDIIPFARANLPPLSNRRLRSLQIINLSFRILLGGG